MRPSIDGRPLGVLTFLLTHLLRGATPAVDVQPAQAEFLLTHLLRGATHMWAAGTGMVDISTHAPLTRCDYTFTLPGVLRTPFLLTHLLRGATIAIIILLGNS